jgi:hypothetical protein
MVEWKVEIPGNTISREWYKYIWVEEPKLEKNAALKGLTLEQLAKKQGKGIIDAFLDLVVEEKLETVFMQAKTISTSTRCGRLRKTGHDAGERGASADLRLGLDLRAL